MIYEFILCWLVVGYINLPFSEFHMHAKDNILRKASGVKYNVCICHSTNYEALP